MGQFGHGWDQFVTASILTLGWYEFLQWERQRGVYLEDSMLMRGDWLAKSTVIAIRWKHIAHERNEYFNYINDEEIGN